MGKQPGETQKVDGGRLEARAATKLNPGAPMPGVVMGRTEGKAGETANIRGTGALGQVGADEIEFGLGIHGEKGVSRGTHQTADQIAAALLDAICADLGLVAGDCVALLVNGLGVDHPAVTREVAAAGGVPLIDLTAGTKALVESLGTEGSKALYLYNEKRDNTHTSVHGATVYAGLVRDGLVAQGLVPEGRTRVG